MKPNPYESSQPVSGIVLPSSFARCARAFAATLIFLCAAAIICALVAYREYQTQVRMQEDGSVLVIWTPLDRLLNGLSMPGAFFVYVVGTLTNSLPLACVAGILGMAVAYGLPGLLIDALRHLANRRLSA